MKNGKFVYASVFICREGYMVVGGIGTVHMMMMVAFGKYKVEEGKDVVMHKDDNKQNCALKNLRMGDSKDNATGKIPVTLSIDGVKNTYDSINEAARETGVTYTAISRNILREWYGEPITSNGIKFMLLDDNKRKREESEEMGTSSENAHRKKRVTLLCSEEPEDGDQE
jgi:hypothetical protein